jgi:hypothetical protein
MGFCSIHEAESAIRHGFDATSRQFDEIELWPEGAANRAAAVIEANKLGRKLRTRISASRETPSPGRPQGAAPLRYDHGDRWLACAHVDHGRFRGAAEPGVERGIQDTTRAILRSSIGRSKTSRTKLAMKSSSRSSEGHAAREARHCRAPVGDEATIHHDEIMLVTLSILSSVVDFDGEKHCNSVEMTGEASRTDSACSPRRPAR